VEFSSVERVSSPCFRVRKTGKQQAISSLGFLLRQHIPRSEEPRMSRRKPDCDRIRLRWRRTRKRRNDSIGTQRFSARRLRTDPDSVDAMSRFLPNIIFGSNVARIRDGSQVTSRRWLALKCLPLPDDDVFSRCVWGDAASRPRRSSTHSEWRRRSEQISKQRLCRNEMETEDEKLRRLVLWTYLNLNHRSSFRAAQVSSNRFVCQWARVWSRAPANLLRRLSSGFAEDKIAEARGLDASQVLPSSAE